MVPLVSHDVLSPEPLIVGVDEACVSCACTSPSADTGICAGSGRRQFHVLYALHTWALWFEASTCAGKANRNCMKFSAENRCLQFRWAGLYLL